MSEPKKRILNLGNKHNRKHNAAAKAKSKIYQATKGHYNYKQQALT